MNIYIEVYSITHPYVGIGEFCLNLGKQLAQRATELKEKYDINLTFIVPKGYEGTFGNDVNYVSFLGDVKFQDETTNGNKRSHEEKQSKHVGMFITICSNAYLLCRIPSSSKIPTNTNLFIRNCRN